MSESSSCEPVVKRWEEPWGGEVPDVVVMPDGTVYRRYDLDDYLKEAEAQGVKIQ